MIKELTPEQAAVAAEAFNEARTHLANAIAELRKMVSAIETVEQKKNSFFSPFGDRGDLRLSQIDDRNLADYQKNLENICWKTVIWQSGIMNAITKDDRCKIEKAVYDGTFGAFTSENIAKTMESLKTNEKHCIQHLAMEAFRHFSPDYARREPIRQRTVKHCGSYGSISFAGYNSPCWEILEKTLLSLDHKPMPEQSDTIVARLGDTVREHRLEFECPYFKAKIYEKSLTAHLTFTRMDLINLINEIGKAA